MTPKPNNRLNWQVISSQGRTTGIDFIKSVISSNGGAIINFNMFSDFALSLILEIEEQRIESLYKDISAKMEILETIPENTNNDFKKEWWILINVSFSSGKGELKVEVPGVPG